MGLHFTERYLLMYRQAAAGEWEAAIATGGEIERVILDSAKLGRPAALAMHPSSEKGQMALDRLRSDLKRYQTQLEIAN